MHMRTLAISVVAGLLLAGCADDDDDAPPTLTGATREPGPQPTLTKETVQSTAPPLMLLGQSEPVLLLEGAQGGGRLLLALDLEAGASPLRLRLLAPDGSVADQADLTASGKRVVEMATAAGTYELFAESESTWTVGVVATLFPAGFDEGLRLQVSTPQETQIDHSFRPASLQAAAGEPVRITLYDFDPHTGIENLQHNLHFPELGLRTTGKTTWGEVRVLDVPGLAAGSYAFECEFHGFTGDLVVA